MGISPINSLQGLFSLTWKWKQMISFKVLIGKVGMFGSNLPSYLGLGYGGFSPRALRRLLTMNKCFISSLATLLIRLVASPSFVMEYMALR
jgi:hypothetical protein